MVHLINVLTTDTNAFAPMPSRLYVSRRKSRRSASPPKQGEERGPVIQSSSQTFNPDLSGNLRAGSQGIAKFILTLHSSHPQHDAFLIFKREAHRFRCFIYLQHNAAFWQCVACLNRLYLLPSCFLFELQHLLFFWWNGVSVTYEYSLTLLLANSASL